MYVILEIKFLSIRRSSNRKFRIGDKKLFMNSILYTQEPKNAKLSFEIMKKID